MGDYQPTTSNGEESDGSETVLKGHHALNLDVYGMTAECLRLVLLAYKDFDTIKNIGIEWVFGCGISKFQIFFTFLHLIISLFSETI